MTPTPPPPANRTSQAVQQMGKTCHSCFHPLTQEELKYESASMLYKQWLAIAAKFQKMEEALQEIPSQVVGPDGKPPIWMKHVEEALSFDPLEP